MIVCPEDAIEMMDNLEELEAHLEAELEAESDSEIS